jgi:beta-lactamase regulating signal transducer with metallopeptidase domain
MTIGTSLLVIAAGAILRFAITVTTVGFSLHTIGDILMIVGVVGFVLALFWSTVWAQRRTTYVRDAYGRDLHVVEDPSLPPR